MERISSRQNALVKRFRALARTGDRKDAVLLDGVHLLREALSAGISVDTVAFADSNEDDEVRALARETERAGIRTIGVTGSVLAAMTPVRSPSGIVAIATIGSAPLAALLKQSPQLIVVLHDVQDPGNVGAVIRAAEACGATGVIASTGTADPFGWKALRGAMGSAFRLPIAVGMPPDDYRPALDAARIAIAATVPRDGVPLPTVDLRTPTAILLGGEGAGLPADLIQGADIQLTIPMRQEVESLNVAVSAAIILYEAARQRGPGGRG